MSAQVRKLTARRENSPHHDQTIAETYQDKWVVRDEAGNFVDWDRYQNDLRARYPGIEIIGK